MGISVPKTSSTTRSYRPRTWHYIVIILVLMIAALIFLWNWDWFIPMAQRMASTALGRPVTITHLHVRITRNPVFEADGVTIANPPDFPAGAPLAQIDRLEVTVNGPAYLGHRALIVPSLVIEQPKIEAIALPDGRNNWTF